MQTLLQTFAEKQKQERPKRYKSMEYRFTGTPIYRYFTPQTQFISLYQMHLQLPEM